MASTDGPTLTAAARASCIPTANRIVLPNNFFYVGRALRIMLGGRISCAATTPGTARFDVCLGSAGTTIIYDTGAINLNIVAKVSVPFLLDLTLVCRAVGTGTSTTFFPMGTFQSEALVGAALPSAGSNGSLIVPVGTPAVGAGCDNSAASALDVFFTQTVATGSVTCHTYRVDALNQVRGPTHLVGRMPFKSQLGIGRVSNTTSPMWANQGSMLVDVAYGDISVAAMFSGVTGSPVYSLKVVVEQLF